MLANFDNRSQDNFMGSSHTLLKFHFYLVIQIQIHHFLGITSHTVSRQLHHRTADIKDQFGIVNQDNQLVMLHIKFSS